MLAPRPNQSSIRIISSGLLDLLEYEYIFEVLEDHMVVTEYSPPAQNQGRYKLMAHAKSLTEEQKMLFAELDIDPETLWFELEVFDDPYEAQAKYLRESLFSVNSNIALKLIDSEMILHVA